jgi:F0F1-type ATP synthase membrane subunit c/vacuolar-type H+-ATPase subunit K
MKKQKIKTGIAIGYGVFLLGAYIAGCGVGKIIKETNKALDQIPEKQ